MSPSCSGLDHCVVELVNELPHMSDLADRPAVLHCGAKSAQWSVQIVSCYLSVGHRNRHAGLTQGPHGGNNSFELHTRAPPVYRQLGVVADLSMAHPRVCVDDV